MKAQWSTPTVTRAISASSAEANPADVLSDADGCGSLYES